MPVSRQTSEGLAPEVAAHYARAEVRLLRMVARHLEAGTGAPDWAEAKLAELQLFRRRADKLMAETTERAVGELRTATQTAYLRGAAAGEGELLAAGRAVDLPPAQAERAVEALARAQADQLEAIGPQVVRQTSDAYREAVVRASSGTLSGAATRRQDAQAALDDLARKGVTGFTDARGRQWGLEAYVDMATRTTTAQAAVTGHMDRLEQGGINLYLVSTSSRECETCRPWEGLVLSRGPVDSLVQNVVTGELERVRVDGTVAEATRAGLFHPNCTHNLSGYLHGASKAGQAEGNPKGYAEKQEQRRLERGVREWKRREAVAITPEAKRKAQAKVRTWQGKLREHTAATGLPRKRYRESFDTAPLQVPGDQAARAGALDALDVEVIDTEMAELMERADYGPRFEQLAAELDRRDQAPTPQTLPPEPDPVAEQAALNRLLFGDQADADVAVDRPREGTRKRDPEAEVREQYEAWLETQFLRAEEATRGNMLSRRSRAEGVDPRRILNRELRSLEQHASPELQEWLAQPGNERLSFPEFRAGLMDDKAAREANQRRRNRGFESEYG